MISRRQYQTYRHQSTALNTKILDAVAKIVGAARTLGIAQDDTLVFDSEAEVSEFMDFALYEHLVEGRNAVQAYRDQVEPKDRREQEILAAMGSSYTSLFRVAATIPRQSSLQLSDLLGKREDLSLIDISFSQTAFPGLLLFARILPFSAFNMTSGMAMAFDGHREHQLLVRYERLRKRIKADNDSIARFVAFFELKRSYGIEVQYQ